jgi:hypothetical protein
VKWRSHRACEGEREVEKERGGRHQWCPFKGERREVGERGGSEVGVGVGVEEGEGRRGGLVQRQVARDGQHRAEAGARRKRRVVALNQGRSGTPTGGPGATVMGGAVKTV